MAQRQGDKSAIETGRLEPGAEDFLTARQAHGAIDSTLAGYANHLGMVRRRSPKPLLELTGKEASALAAKIARMKSGYSLSITVRMFYSYHFGKEDERTKAFLLDKKQKRLAPKDLLEIADVNAMIGAAGTMRDKALLAVLWETGARIHEVLALDMGDVTPVPSPENGGKKFYKVFFRKVKVQGEEHSVLLIEAAPHLSDWLKAYPLTMTDKAPLFPTADHGRFGLRMTPSGARVVIRSVARKAGIQKPVNPHAFRHARATFLLRAQIGEPQVKRLLGWTPASTMLGRYSHLADKDVDDAMLRMHGLKPGETPELGTLNEPTGNMVPAMPIADPEVFEERRAMAWLLSDPQLREGLLALIRQASQRPLPG